MTVKELVSKLSTLPEGYTVLMDAHDGAGAFAVEVDDLQPGVFARLRPEQCCRGKPLWETTRHPHRRNAVLLMPPEGN